MARYFRFPWANAGDRTTIPDETQSDGAVSYNQGYGPDYQRNPATDPSARRIERQMYNQALFDVTSTLQEYYQNAVPEFITAAANGGTAFSYPIYARVRYNPGSGERVYESTVANNTNIPTVTTAWRLADFSGLDARYGLGSSTPLRTGTAAGNVPLIGTPGTTAAGGNSAVIIREGNNANGNFRVYSHGPVELFGVITADLPAVGITQGFSTYNYTHTLPISVPSTNTQNSAIFLGLINGGSSFLWINSYFGAFVNTTSIRGQFFVTLGNAPQSNAPTLWYYITSRP